MKQVFLIASLFLAGIIQAQKIELNNSVADLITNTTPQAFQFQKYGMLPVSYSTGVMNVQIPFFNIGIKGVDWNIGISYQTGGIRVGEVSGCVGLGWNLQGAGVISSRTYEQSDLITSNEGDNPANKKSFQLTPATGPLAVGSCSYVNGADVGFVRNLFDAQRNEDSKYFINNIPDIFYLNAGSLSSTFFLKNHSGYSLPSQDISITHIPGPSNDPLGTIQVLDQQGNKYTFIAGGYNGTSSQDENSAELEGAGPPQTTFSSYNPVFVLKKIENPFGERIDFYYSVEAYSYRGMNQDVYYEYPSGNNDCLGRTSGFGEHKKTYSHVNDIKLDSIVTTRGEKVTFGYSARNDMAGANKLDIVTRYYKSGAVYIFRKAFRLNNGYFGTGTNARELRLKLNSVQELDANGQALNPYSFTYNSTNLPSRISPAQDGAGFYNGHDNNLNLVSVFGGDRSFSVTHAKACILEKVVYPTGGFTTFDYELKSFGGLRILEVKDYNDANTSFNLRRYEYPNMPTATGSLPPFKKDINFYKLICFQIDHAMTQVNCPFTAYYTDAIKPISETVLGLGVERYQYVIEYSGTNGINGKTEYKYGLTNSTVRTGMMGFDDVLKEKTVFRKNGAAYEIVSKEISEYGLLNETESTGFFGDAVNSREVRSWGLTFDAEKEEMSSTSSDCGGTGQQQSLCYPANYFQQSLRLTSSPVLLMAQRSYSYAPNATDYLEKVKTFTYNPNTILAPASTEETVSNGDVIKQTSSYPSNYAGITATDALSAGIKNLQTLHIINSPVEHAAFLKKSGASTFKLTQSALVSYKSSPPLPDRLSAIETDIPVSDFVASGVNAGAITKDVRYSDKILFNAYDNSGNLLEQQKVNDQKLSYIWDYNKAYPIATAINTSQDQIAYTSFEADGAGNWSGINVANIVSTASLTGKKSYYQAGFSFSKSGLTSGTAYVLSYWSMNGSYTVSGTLTGWPKNIRTVSLNGQTWTQYEHKVSGITTVSVSGSGFIDEIRLLPANAQMNSYVYDPAIGQSSTADANNTITFYEYDNFNRLKNIKDYQGNIVKNYQYNYANSCGSNCVVLQMQTFTGYNTPSYPVGVFNGAKQYIGIATTPAQYVTLWNSNAANQAIGVLSANADSLHFNLSLATNATPPPVVFGLRFYKWTGVWQTTISIVSDTLSYVDWGDGSAELLTQARSPFYNTSVYYYVRQEAMCYGVGRPHTYANSQSRNITVFHNETTERVSMSVGGGQDDLLHESNISGNYPEKVRAINYNDMSNCSDTGVLNFNKLTEVVTSQYQMGNSGSTRHNNWQNINHFHKMKWVKVAHKNGSEIMNGNLRINFPNLNYLECQENKPDINTIWTGAGFKNLYVIIIGLKTGSVSTSEIDLILNSQASASTEINGRVGFAPTPQRSNASNTAYNTLIALGWNLSEIASP